MAITSPNMALRRWDQPNDAFSYTDLADNWNKVDLHDHSSGKGVQVPTGGLANLAVTTTKLADSSVTSAKIVDGTVADTDIASPNNGVWRHILQASGVVGGGATAGTYFLAQGGGVAIASGSASTSGTPIIRYQGSDYAVASKTTNLRIQVALGINGTAPGITYTFGLYPVSSGGGTATSVALTLGTVVAGSTVNFASPSASGPTGGNSAGFTGLATGYYVFGVTLSGTAAANAAIAATCLLQLRHT